MLKEHVNLYFLEREVVFCFCLGWCSFITHCCRDSEVYACDLKVTMNFKHFLFITGILQKILLYTII